MCLHLGVVVKCLVIKCVLKKLLYSLKQEHKQWKKLKGVFIKYGFILSLNDYSLFTFSKDEVFLVLSVYVNDIILTGNDVFFFNRIKYFFDEKFKIKDLSILQYFLNVEVVSQ